jgi:hypothetical protein
MDHATEAEALLYVRSGAVASRLYLSFDAIASDLYWIRAIVHVGRERESGDPVPRFALLEPLVTLTVALDPHFNVAYRVGAILLAEPPPNGPGRPDRAIALLERGLSANPGRWQYAHDIGFIHYFHTGRFDEAARWFRRAASMPDSPRFLEPVAAMTLARGGDEQGARQLLVDLAASSEGYIRRAAERGLAQLRALDEIERLHALLAERLTRTGGYPNDLADLGDVPHADPSGHPYVYDPIRGVVGIAPGSPLSPLPQTFNRR